MSGREHAPRGLVSLAALVIVLAGLRAASDVVEPVLLAMFLAFVSSPLVFRLSRHRRVPYYAAVTLVLFLQFAILSTIGILVASSATRFQERLPALRSQLDDAEASAIRWVADQTGLSLREAAELTKPDALFDAMGDIASGLASMLSSTVLVVLVLAFTLFDAARIWRLIDQHFDEQGDGPIMARVATEVNRYLSIKTSISLITGVLLGLWCWFLDVEFALLWGLLAFVLNYIPNVGPLLAAIPPMLVAVILQGPGAALAVGGGHIVVHLILGNIIEPKLMGDALGMSSVVVILSFVLWGWVLGPIGALLSVPLTMIVKIALANTRDGAWVADLMSAPVPARERPVPLPEASARADSAITEENA